MNPESLNLDSVCTGPKESIRVKNEPRIIESRLRVHGAWNYPDLHL